jgi:hypothetical protein
MTLQELRDSLGIYSFGHRVKIMNGLQLLRIVHPHVHHISDWEQGRVQDVLSPEFMVSPCPAMTNIALADYFNGPQYWEGLDGGDSPTCPLVGNCTIRYSNGHIYRGTISSRGEREGYGMYFNPDSQYLYYGNFNKNITDRVGVLVTDDGFKSYGIMINDIQVHNMLVTPCVGTSNLLKELVHMPFFICFYIPNTEKPLGRHTYRCLEDEFHAVYTHRRGVPYNGVQSNTGSFYLPPFDNIDSYLHYRSNCVISKLPILEKQLLRAREIPIIRQIGGHFDGPDPNKIFGSGSYFMAPSIKLIHDYEQLSYLVRKGKLPSSQAVEAAIIGFQQAIAASVADEKAASFSQERWGRILSIDEYISIGAFYQQNYYRPNLARVKYALNPNLDYQSLEDLYMSGSPELLYFDNFLSKEALDALYDFTLESTIFYDVHESYFGAYSHAGFSGPLIDQIAEELRGNFPRVFEGHPLSQVWAYKYVNDRYGIRTHADDAAVNINFWLAPDEANLDPQSGGLRVYTHEAPDEWTFSDFNSDMRAKERDVRGLTLCFYLLATLDILIRHQLRDYST